MVLLILSLVIAVIAALMPLWQFLINKWFKRLKINFFEDEELYISSYSINSLFTLDVKNRDIIVREVALEIKRKTDDKKIDLKWDCHVSTNYKGMDADIERRIAYPLKVEKGSCEVFHLKYLRTDSEYTEMKEASVKVDLLKNEMNKKRKSTFGISPQDIRKSEEYKIISAGFMDRLFWQEGDYNIKYSIKYNKSVMEKEFIFSLSKEDSQTMQVNIHEYLLAGVSKGMKIYSGVVKIKEGK